MDIEEQQQEQQQSAVEEEPMVVDPPSLGLEAMQVTEPPAADAATASSDTSDDIKDDLDLDTAAEGDAGALSAEQKLIKAVNFKDRCVIATGTEDLFHLFSPRNQHADTA
jgi:hypothetical protein